MSSKWYRTVTKGVLWEALGILIMFLLTFSISISLTYFSIRIVMYFIYHRLWKLCKWGKEGEERE